MYHSMPLHVASVELMLQMYAPSISEAYVASGSCGYYKNRSGRTRPHPGSQVPPARKEMRGLAGRSGWRGTRRGEANGGGVRVQGETRRTGTDARVQ
jgi:hypothetical protein